MTGPWVSPARRVLIEDLIESELIVGGLSLQAARDLRQLLAIAAMQLRRDGRRPISPELSRLVAALPTASDFPPDLPISRVEPARQSAASSPARYLSTSEAAKALSRTERAIRYRADAGTAGRSRQRGATWEIDGDWVESEREKRRAEADSSAD